MSARKLRTALVGCGQIADAHLQVLGTIPGAELVAVCDRQRDLAEQASARFGWPRVFDDLDQLLSSVRPDVVHITTPPHTHRATSVAALKAGAHVYVEKPFAVNLAEAQEILATAEAQRRLVCLGHDQLFDPAWEQCRRLHRKGKLGQVVHVDAVLGYDLQGPFGSVVTSEPTHWIRRLPGGIFHNTISHAICKIAEFLTDERPRVWATWFGGEGTAVLPTELRVVLMGEEMTAYLLSSARARPVQRLTRVYGTRQCVEVDLDGRLLRCSRPGVLPGPFAKIEAPFRHLGEAAHSLRRNLWDFLRCDLHYFTGMNRLFERFYRTIAEGGEPPIPYREICRVTAIMDRIFECCQDDAGARMPPVSEPAEEWPPRVRQVLVPNST
jgi:predicted dehydrogenase